MPTVVLLDTSTSMNSSVVKLRAEKYTPLQYAFNGLHAFFDSVAASSKLEFVSMVTFSPQLEVISSFTRDFDLLKLKLMQLTLCDAFHLEYAIQSIEPFIIEEWGSGVSCNVLVVVQEKFIAEACALSLYRLSGNIIAASLGPDMTRLEYFPTLENFNCRCEVFQPEVPITINSIQQMFINIAEKYYATWIGQLVCGNFNSKITLSPSPESYLVATDFDSTTYHVDSVLEVCGFIELQHLGSPGAVSRHLVLPYSPPPVYPLINRPLSINRNGLLSPPNSDDDLNDEGQTPSFCVLLHGALKVENMAALCYMGNNWYGVLFSWADSKKKSNLMLSLLEPGSLDAIPWIGNLSKLIIPTSSQADFFPMKSPEKKSYTQNCVAWIRQQGLQSDVQKILRHSRKLPEKTQHFYKELNRVRRAAIGLGFFSLIEGLAAVLERECTLLPGTAHPACALQLTHAAGVLKEPYCRDAKFTILPLKTSF